ncbi:hypothetical protein [uncultured Tateyamaria sp.]|uniref:hypothetical protein n=1 Tax=uncultured Tateyamaria sp. TaxID=455651 RepID=UPI0026188249|nr:hypothetical protein [uncultured Tateyamaria sp.]
MRKLDPHTPLSALWLFILSNIIFRDIHPFVLTSHPAMRTVWTGKASIMTRHCRKIGLALLIAAALWFLLSTIGMSSALVARLETGLPVAYVGWAVLLVYVILLAIPFVPSAEIGVAVMLALGSSMAIPVYAATILGLTIAFEIGRLGHRYRLGDAGGKGLQTSDVLTILQERFRERPVLRRILRFRGLAVIVMINMPGNTVLGGGGGIAMVLGYSRTLTFRGFFACAAVAVAPVPALFLVADTIGLEAWMHEWLGRFS